MMGAPAGRGLGAAVCILAVPSASLACESSCCWSSTCTNSRPVADEREVGSHCPEQVACTSDLCSLGRKTPGHRAGTQTATSENDALACAAWPLRCCVKAGPARSAAAATDTGTGCAFECKQGAEALSSSDVHTHETARSLARRALLLANQHLRLRIHTCRGAAEPMHHVASAAGPLLLRYALAPAARLKPPRHRTP